MLLYSALSMQTMLTNQSNIKQLVTHTKQGINIHAKAYKVIAKQYKAIHATKQNINTLAKHNALTYKHY